MQGLAFDDHDESSTSLNKGNFLEMIDWCKDRMKEVRHAYDYAPRSCIMTSPEIQKDLAKCCAQEITEIVLGEIGDRQFSVIIDESCGISIREQMAVIVRYLNNHGQVVERFLALQHVAETIPYALKETLFDLFDHHGLSIFRLRGQGYNGDSNMRDEYNCMQGIILDENPYAFYVHCFVYQLQSVVVSVTSSCSPIYQFFEHVSLIVTVTRSPCKTRDASAQKLHTDILDKLESGDIFTGRSLHQENNISWPDRTILGLYHKTDILDKLESGEIFTGRSFHQENNIFWPDRTIWGSYHTTLVHLETMWDSVLDVLMMVHDHSRVPTRAAGLIVEMESFIFVFILKLMLRLFAVTNELSLVLQRKNLNIVHAVELLDDGKARLDIMRIENGWAALFGDAVNFCVNKSIPVPYMNEEIPVWGHSRCRGITISNLKFYLEEIFFASIDKMNTELRHRFNEASIELLVRISCLDPRNSFVKFDVNKLARLAEIYDEDFSIGDCAIIRDQLETYILHVRRHAAFSTCQDLPSLAMKMIETEKHMVFPLVYKLIELALLLPVSTAAIERTFLQ